MTQNISFNPFQFVGDLNKKSASQIIPVVKEFPTELVNQAFETLALEYAKLKREKDAFELAREINEGSKKFDCLLRIKSELSKTHNEVFDPPIPNPLPRDKPKKNLRVSFKETDDALWLSQKITDDSLLKAAIDSVQVEEVKSMLLIKRVQRAINSESLNEARKLIEKFKDYPFIELIFLRSLTTRLIVLEKEKFKLLSEFGLNQHSEYVIEKDKQIKLLLNELKDVFSKVLDSKQKEIFYSYFFSRLIKQVSVDDAEEYSKIFEADPLSLVVFGGCLVKEGFKEDAGKVLNRLSHDYQLSEKLAALLL